MTTYSLKQAGDLSIGDLIVCLGNKLVPVVKVEHRCDYQTVYFWTCEPHNEEIINAYLSNWEVKVANVDEDKLKKLLLAHRKCTAINGGWTYECLCGEPLSSNSHYTMAKHQADIINQAFAKGELA